MADMTLTFTTKREQGIYAARMAYNATLTAAEGKTVQDNPLYADTNEKYVQGVMNMAADSYLKQYGLWEEPTATPVAKKR